MTETKNIKTTTETKATATATAKPEVTETAKKRITQESALMSAVRAHKSFKLARSVYENNGKYYYAFSAFIVLDGNKQHFIEIPLVPNIGYVKSDDNYGRVSRNASSYGLLNFLYDCGQGLNLEIRKRAAEKGVDTVAFDYYAVAEDDNGISVECQLLPKNPGTEGYLRAAFTGFGKCRDYTDEDIAKIPGLAEAFKRILLPGEEPDVKIEEV